MIYLLKEYTKNNWATMEDNLQDFDNIIETAIDNHSFRKIPIQFDPKNVSL